MKTLDLLKSFVALIIFGYNNCALAAGDTTLGIFALEFEPPAIGAAARRAVELEKQDWGCQFSFNSVVDSRENKETIGATSYSKPLRAHSVDNWLEAFKSHMQSTLFDDSPNFEKQSAIVDMELIRLYTYVQGNSVFGLVAIKLFVQQGTRQEEMYLRGYSSVASSGLLSTYKKAVNRASYDLADRVASELSTRCVLEGHPG